MLLLHLASQFSMKPALSPEARGVLHSTCCCRAAAFRSPRGGVGIRRVVELTHCRTVLIRPPQYRPYRGTSVVLPMRQRIGMKEPNKTVSNWTSTVARCYPLTPAGRASVFAGIASLDAEDPNNGWMTLSKYSADSEPLGLRRQSPCRTASLSGFE
jgi:hypothetical protein